MSPATHRLLKDLNEPQAKAVTTTEGPLLVLAGAGSGKTKTLVHRVAYLIAVRKVPPQCILAVTFTNRAAQEMRQRVAELVGRAAIGVGQATVGTFHAVSCRFLRHEAKKLGYPANFSIYDEDDQKALVKQALRDLGYGTKRVQPGAVLGAISRAKSDLMGPSEYGAEVADDYFTELVARVYVRYQELLHENRAYDFDDLIGQVVKLWQDFPSVLEKYHKNYKYILVDEYQDVNRAQYVWTELLAKGSKNLCVVGDDWQSIYGWRGADFGNILRFTEDYSEAKVVKLEQNYRSTKVIVQAGNAVMAKAERKADKLLWTNNPQGELIRLVEVEDEVAEARFVVEDVERLVAESVPVRGIRIDEQHVVPEYSDDAAEETLEAWRTSQAYRQAGKLPEYMQVKRFSGDRNKLRGFAVLYRTNAQSRALEEACLRAGMPYQLVGAIRFYERREVKDMLAYLRLILNPADGVSFERAILSSPRGVGLSTVEQVLTLAQEKKITALEVVEQGLLELPPARAESLERFVHMLKRLGRELPKLSVAEVIDQVAQGGGLVEHLQDGTSTGESRLQNIAELKTVAEERAPGTGREAMERFLTDVSLWQDQDAFDEDKSGITLMTVHAAKGLEFDNVYLVGMEEGLFPHTSALDETKELEEERRLAYVAITRARKRATCVYAAQRRIFGSVAPGIPSRFLGELPQELVEVTILSPF